MPPLSKNPSNFELAQTLESLAQLMVAGKENPYKARAYRRAAATLKMVPDSVSAMIARGDDLKVLPGIGDAIAGALRDLVQTGTLSSLEERKKNLGAQGAALAEIPGLPAKLLQQVFSRLKISTLDEVRLALEDGSLEKTLGTRVERQVRRAFSPAKEILLADADEMARHLADYLRRECGASRAEIAGEVRRRVELVTTLTFVVATTNFPSLLERFQNYGGQAKLENAGADEGNFQLPSGLGVRIVRAEESNWGAVLARATASAEHWDKFQELVKAPAKTRIFSTEKEFFEAHKLSFIEPELRTGREEVAQARRGAMPPLVIVGDIRGELHAHTTGSDGVHSILEMAEAARERGYEYFGVSDHSQSLKIAGGLSVEKLWKQIRLIDKLNAKGAPVRILKSAEVDILADGTLDYPDDLLAALDYTVCSIHSRFALGREAQTERLLRAMENKYFNILGHATGRLLLRRPGYEIDLERLIPHARERGCFFEINASPDRLDLSAESAREVKAAGIKIAICTDAHSRDELDYLRGGVDQARRAGLGAEDVLNTYPWAKLQKFFRR